MYISRGFSHGISSPVTEVGRIFFFVFLSVVFRFLFPFFHFFFVISYQSENRTNDYWVSKPGVRDANLFLDFQGTAELSVTVASVQLHRESLY